ncbi:MAG TPA: argininosuccinate lyase [Candidatus Scatosoma pullicola]|nr:argininosuccinate lyase [Candidatus Scatosoma pullicola]
MKLWQGRFAEPTAADADAFNESLSFDKKLYKADITASLAHAEMLGRCGILSEADAAAIKGGLEAILSDIEGGRLEISGQEDIHSFVENELVSRIGDAGKRLHTARSRNDQVATDFRLYVRSSAEEVVGLLKKLVSTLVSLSEKYAENIMPGYTHLRKAQPINCAQYFNAYSEMFLRDADRFCLVRRRADVMPLGSGALAGTSYPIDREITRELLGFSEISQNSLDGVSDRDFAAEYLFAASLAMAHLSRLCEDAILYTSTEFGFWEMPDAYSTGSSIMPQKKNPDICELVRGKTGRVYGDLVALLTAIKGIPLAYNKDLQEDKEGLFDAEKTLKDCLAIFAEMMGQIGLNTERMEEAAAEDFTCATDVADYLAKKGVPFRTAHGIVGGIVRECLERGRTLSDMTLAEYKAHSPVFEEDITEIVKAKNSANSRSSVGGSSVSAARAGIDSIRRRLALLPY